MNNIKITKEDFEAYYKVQMSGEFNMLDIYAIKATKLTKAQYMDILLSYNKYYKKFKTNQDA